MKKNRIRLALITTLFALVASCVIVISLRSVQGSPQTGGLTFIVNSTGDAADNNPGDGLCFTGLNVGVPPTAECTLRAAIQEANSTAAADSINFLIPATDANCVAASGTCTISPASALPTVSQPLTIDGYTQPTSTQNSLLVGNNADINIELNGANAGAGADGLRISAGSSTVRGLAVYKFGGDGIELNTNGSNTIAGNFIGTNSTGTATALGNAGDGVNVSNVSSNAIGGATTQARNLISGNTGDGVDVTGTSAASNVVQGNYIGVRRDGTSALANSGNGVFVAGPSNQIGGATSTPGQNAGNVISGNALSGVRVSSGGNNSSVQGNLIGLPASGSTGTGNGNDGVFITNGATGCAIGGSAIGHRNIISGNTGDGVEINGAGTNSNTVAGNRIGTDAAGTTARANTGRGVFITASAQSNTVGGLTSQPGSQPGNLISGNSSAGIEINGTSSATTSLNVVQGNMIGLKANGIEALRNNSNGVLISSSASNTIGGSDPQARNVISAHNTTATSDGVDVTGDASDNNTVAGNYIGTDLSGNVAIPNANGVSIAASADNNVIGGATPTPGAAPGNVISGNSGNGVVVNGTNVNNNSVVGNLIGTDATGSSDLGNADNGVLVTNNATSNQIGGATSTPGAGLGNVISGNDSDGIELSNAGNILVRGNLIGTHANGFSPIPNLGHGVHSSANNATANAVGGTEAGASNVIAYNGGDGVFVALGSVTIRRNSIHSNSGLGIDLGADGVTPNDAGDADAGANSLQNFPVITDARTGSTVVTGTLNSTPSTTFQIDFYSSATPDETAHGEGETYLDSTSVTTDASGNASFNHTATATAPLGHVITATATNPSGHTSEFSNTHVVLAATLAHLRDFNAARVAQGVALSWTTSYEIDNLGFRLYREDSEGARTLITPALIAGSALTTGPNVALTAGNSYSWLDREGAVDSRYWLEDVDTSGETTLHGPFWPVSSSMEANATNAQRSQLISDLGAETNARTENEKREAWAAPHSGRRVTAAEDDADKRAGALDRQRVLAASRKAVKIFVRSAGWRRMTRAEIEAAGFPKSANPARISLYAEGVEHAIHLDASKWNTADAGLEFYGEGLDTPHTDARVYWLVEGVGAGRRTSGANLSSGGRRDTYARDADESNAGIASPPSVERNEGAPHSIYASSFMHTVERRDRNIYFSGLLNGDAENFFGRAVTMSPVAQSLDVRSPFYSNDAEQARLEVALQGVTAGPHRVRAELNGIELGHIEFNGRENKSASFDVSGASLREGENIVTLASSAPADVSLTDYVRLTYRRALRADQDSLRFDAEAGTRARVSGFTDANVRVVDVTEASNVIELSVSIEREEDGGYAASVEAPASGSARARTLLAFAPSRVSSVDEAKANQPSQWSKRGSRADLIVIAHADFLDAAAPLISARTREGLKVDAVDVEDLYDEFSFGARTPEALRQFLSLSYKQGGPPSRPRYAILLGDASYDPRNRLGRGGFDFVPSKLVDTAKLETASDDWLADFNDDGAAEMALGRIPARTLEDARLFVEKIAGFSASAFVQRVVTVADRTGADGFSFETATSGVESLLPSSVAVGRINRGTRAAEEVRAEILSEINAGPSLVNWMGHGSVSVWTGDGLLRAEDAASLSNGSRLSFFVLMTCLNGYYHDPSLESLAESLLKAPAGGALAVWASSGMVEPDEQAAMNRELFAALFAGNGATRLGDAIRRAKGATADADTRRTWILIGDPTARLVAAPPAPRKK